MFYEPLLRSKLMMQKHVKYDWILLRNSTPSLSFEGPPHPKVDYYWIVPDLLFQKNRVTQKEVSIPENS